MTLLNVVSAMKVEQEMQLRDLRGLSAAKIEQELQFELVDDSSTDEDIPLKTAILSKVLGIYCICIAI